MIRPVYALLDSCNDELVRLAWSIAGAAIVAVAENPDLVFDDGSVVDLVGLEERLGREAVVYLYSDANEAPVGRIERHLVGP